MLPNTQKVGLAENLGRTAESMTCRKNVQGTARFNDFYVKRSVISSLAGLLQKGTVQEDNLFLQVATDLNHTSSGADLLQMGRSSITTPSFANDLDKPHWLACCKDNSLV